MMNGIEMPKYRAHKTVWALKIHGLKQRQLPHNANIPEGSLFMVPEDPRFAGEWLSPEYVARHEPQAGGYYVVYEDGYKSFSPAKAFEDGYTAVATGGQTMDVDTKNSAHCDCFVAGMKRAAEIVKGHWNSADSVCNQKAQALRSSAAILRAALELAPNNGCKACSPQEETNG